MSSVILPKSLSIGQSVSGECGEVQWERRSFLGKWAGKDPTIFWTVRRRLERRE